ncbi:uncharacterized protein BT62DRAFT_923388 [Guyanagaster necrorhizus]|uniref:Uncharacterized protein n=1 Tax=Guyanagaster necrorhizus TaxID=856835 RepID=A0A9P8AN67_9AGAR|nr:uncharacterized protein BT62DRAFT_923388 [Guyanagaster necrorhizus MCA 3950]KAG7441441.1 hypothetical protein BT62DRAFT_923388 [Guyanagaster necrorhizus MCA 3950]
MDEDMKPNGASATRDAIHALWLICDPRRQISSPLPHRLRNFIEFAVALRLPSWLWLSKKKKQQRADEVMKKLGLSACAHTLVGNQLLKGISGGSFTATSIMDVLRQLSSSELFEHFGNVLLLTKDGKVAYSGSASGMGMLEYMHSIMSALFFSLPSHDTSVFKIVSDAYREFFPNMVIYPMERGIFYQEYSDDGYSIEGFFLVYTILELPLQVVACFVFSALAVVAINLSYTMSTCFSSSLSVLCVWSMQGCLLEPTIFNMIFNEHILWR